MSRRYPTHFQQNDGWTDWVPPVMTGYRMACCDCGLVHEMNFAVVKVLHTKPNGIKTVKPAGKGYEVMFKARRHRRATAQMRRNKTNLKNGHNKATRIR